MADNIYGGVLQRPEVGFDTVRDGRRAPIFWYDVDLSSARSIADGTAEILPMAGDSFYADLDPVNQGEAVVTFQDTNLTSHGAPIFVTRGHIVNVPFTKLLIENAAQPGKRLRFFYGVGLDFRPGASSSVSVSGEVSVIDGGKSRTLSGNAFAWQCTTIASAGQCPHAQLWNPTGGSKNLIVEALNLSLLAAGGISLGLHNVKLTPLGTPIGKKKSSSAVASVAEGRIASTVFTPGGLGILGGQFMPASGVWSVQLREPIVVEPGTGLMISSDNSTGTTLTGMVEFFEESV